MWHNTVYDTAIDQPTPCCILRFVTPFPFFFCFALIHFFPLCFDSLFPIAMGRAACARQPCTACCTVANAFMHSQQGQSYAQLTVAVLCTLSSGLADVGGVDRQSAAAARGQPLLYLHSLCQGRGHTRVWVPAFNFPAQQKFRSPVL